MVLFVFIIMMLNVEELEEMFFPAQQWLPAAGLGIAFVAAGVLMFSGGPQSQDSRIIVPGR